MHRAVRKYHRARVLSRVATTRDPMFAAADLSKRYSRILIELLEYDVEHHPWPQVNGQYHRRSAREARYDAETTGDTKIGKAEMTYLVHGLRAIASRYVGLLRI